MDSAFSYHQREGEPDILTGYEPQSKRLKLDKSSMASTSSSRERDEDVEYDTNRPDTEPSYKRPKSCESSMACTSLSDQIDNEFTDIAPPNNRLKYCESSNMYDVFINHRGPDTKEQVAIPLYDSLWAADVSVYLDKEENELSDSISSKIKEAIFSASVHIVIFSPKYGDSAWCLAELTSMLLTRAPIIPVFYGVLPSDVKHLCGSFGKNFSEYIKKRRHPDKVEKWKKSLEVVSDILGKEFSSERDINDQCETLVDTVKVKLKVLAKSAGPSKLSEPEVETRKIPLEVARYKVGLCKLVQNFEVHCQKMCEERGKMVGIFGIGGSGKTTLAKELFNRKCSDYSRASFLFKVREACANGQLTSVQSKLLRDLFPTCNWKICDRDEGINLLRFKLKGLRNFLIIIDDVDDPEQLNALMPFHTVNANSLVIVIARDNSVLDQANISIRYKIDQMDPKYGTKLLAYHAFQKEPTCADEYLVKSLVGKCGGLPLTLQVLGGHAFKSRDTLQSVLERVPGTLESILQLNYGALPDRHKDIFLDIACFFIEKEVEMAKRIWKALNWDCESALQNLRDRCLVDVVRQHLDEEPPTYVFRMDQGIREFGIKMAESMEPKRVCPRLYNFLDSDKFPDILTKPQEESIRCLGSIMDMSITYFLVKSKTSSALQWLELDSTSIPVCIPLQELEGLRVMAGLPKSLWQQHDQASWKLKELLCKFITDKCIEKTKLQKKWTEYSKSLENLSQLESLILRLTSGSKSSVSVQVKWNSFVESLERFTSLKTLNLSGLNIVGETAGISRFTSLGSLESLTLSEVAKLSEVSLSGEYYPNLKFLKIEAMKELTKLDLKGVRTLKCLEVLHCGSLKIILGNNMSNLEMFSIESCSDIEQLPDLTSMSLLKKIKIIACEILESIEGIKYLSSLEDITVTCCGKLKTLTGIENLQKLKSMILSDGSVCRCVTHFQKLPSNFTVVMGGAALPHLNEDQIRELLHKADSHCQFESRDNGYKMLRSFLKPDKSFSAIILCAMVVSRCPTYIDERGKTIRLSWLREDDEEEDEKLIYTIVVKDPNEISMLSHSIPGYSWMPTFQLQEGGKCSKPRGEIVKGYILGMSKGQECEIFSSLTNRLYKD